MTKANGGEQRAGAARISWGQLFFDDIILLLGLGILFPLGFYIVWGLLSIGGTPNFSPPAVALAATQAPAPAAMPAAGQRATQGDKPGEVALTVVAAQGDENGGLNFNGVDKGRLVVTVAAGNNVALTMVNKGAIPHSLQIIPYAQTPPVAAAGPPAFAGAQTPDPVAGTAPGQSATARFTAGKPGRYLLICGVPGHALAGMYGILEVSSSATAKPGGAAK